MAMRPLCFVEQAIGLMPETLHSVPVGRITLAIRQTYEGSYAVLEMIGYAASVLAVVADLAVARAYLHARAA
jgi:hypothetical protein